MSISALAEVQWEGLPIHRLVKGHLEVFGSTAHQVDISGEDFLLSPEAAQNLGLILHELSTNSIKYGALSVREGRVRLHWALNSTDHDSVTMEWTETGGPPASQPSRRGFGSTIIKRHAESAFSAVVSTDYAQTGFTWSMTAPVERLLKRNSGPETA